MRVPKNEVLRYLGYSGQEISPNTMALVDECITEIQAIAVPKHIYEIFPIQKDSEHIYFIGTNLEFSSKDVSKLLKDCDACVILGATLGAMVDKKIAVYQKINMAKAVVLNACAAAAIEEVCNDISDEVDVMARSKNLYSTRRYSPGYGDLSIAIQRSLLTVLSAPKKIGLTCTDSSILLPEKSVTAFIGISKKNTHLPLPSCQGCNRYSSCQFKKEGGSCVNS